MEKPRRVEKSLFPKMLPVGSSMKTMFLNPELQIQDLVDRLNDEKPIPSTPITKLVIHGTTTGDQSGDSDPVIAELVEQVADLRETVHLIGESFSGPIPQARDLKQYTPEQQERILRMAEAPRTDESARRTMVAKAGIEQAQRSTWVQVGMFGVCLSLSAVSFWVFDNTVAGSLFIGLPVLNFIAGIRWNIRRGHRNTSEEE